MAPAPNHYLNQCWFIVHWTFRNKRQWNSNGNTIVWFVKMHLKMSVKMAILSRGRWQSLKYLQYNSSYQGDHILYNPCINSPDSQCSWRIITFWYERGFYGCTRKHCYCSVSCLSSANTPLGYLSQVYGQWSVNYETQLLVDCCLHACDCSFKYKRWWLTYRESL